MFPLSCVCCQEKGGPFPCSIGERKKKKEARFDLVRAVLSGTREVELKYLPVLTQTSWPYFVPKNTTSTAQTVRVVPAADEVRMKGFAF